MNNDTWALHMHSVNTRNGMACYDHCDSMMKLWNDNYHQMVIMLVNIVKTLSPLRIEAPEWYPMEQQDEIAEEKVGEKCKQDDDWVKRIMRLE